MISGEWCAFTNFPWGRGIINFNQDEENLAMETYHSWARLFELQRYYSWIIDRFHLSTIMHQKRYCQRDYNFEWLEKRLLPLNFRLIYLYRSPDSFAAAKAERLKVSGNPSQYDDISRFIAEQKALEKLVDNSMLPVFRYDISHNEISKAADSIADYLESSGGLWMER